MKRTNFNLLLAVLVMVASSWPAQQARADGQPALLVLYADSDALSDGDKGTILKQQKEFLAKYKKYTFLDTPKVDLLDEMVNFECLEMDADCLSKIAGPLKAELVLYTNWESGTLTMKLVNVADKTVVKEFSAAAKKKSVKNVAAKGGILKVFGPLPKKKVLILVNIDSNVESAEVFINQKRVGTTRLKVKLKQGKYTVSVRKKGFLMVEETLDVAGPDAVEWKAMLKPIPTKVDHHVVVKPPIPPKPKKDDEVKKPWYKTWWFWTVTGVSLLAITGGIIYAVYPDSGTYDTGTVKFSISPASAEKDYIFYQ